MAESADALDSGSSRGNSVEVQVLLSAPAWRWTQFVLGSVLFFVLLPDNSFGILFGPHQPYGLKPQGFFIFKKIIDFYFLTW